MVVAMALPVMKQQKRPASQESVRNKLCLINLIISLTFTVHLLRRGVKVNHVVREVELKSC